MKVGLGVQVFATIVGLMAIVNWWFKSNFDTIANSRAATINQQLESTKPNIFGKLPLIYVLTLLAVLYLAVGLVFESEIWGHMGFSLLEVLCGLGLGGLAAQTTFVLLSRSVSLRKLIFLVMPLTHISAIVLWLIVFVMWQNSISNFVYFWHKVIAIGFLTFYPLIRSLWGLRDRPIFYRFLLAIDEALPIAFVGMFFGEGYAASQGLGFFAVIAKVTDRSAQAISACLVAIALVFALSALLRWTLKACLRNELDARPSNNGGFLPGLNT